MNQSVRQLFVVVVAVLAFSGRLSAAEKPNILFIFADDQCFQFNFLMHNWYRYFFILFIILSSIVSLDAAVGLIDGCFALMAIPTTVSAILLAPKVKQAADLYFASRKTNAI